MHQESIHYLSEQNFELMKQIQPECAHNQTMKGHFFPTSQEHLLQDFFK